jgi:hypothetical protein
MKINISWSLNIYLEIPKKIIVLILKTKHGALFYRPKKNREKYKDCMNKIYLENKNNHYLISFHITIPWLWRRWQPLYKNSSLSIFTDDYILWRIRRNWLSGLYFEWIATLRSNLSIIGFDTDLVPGMTVEISNGVRSRLTTHQDFVYLACRYFI